MKPTKGILQARCKQIFVIRALPAEVNTYKEVLDLKMNDDEKNTQVNYNRLKCFSQIYGRSDL